MAKQPDMDGSLALALTKQSSFCGYLDVKEAESETTFV